MRILALDTSSRFGSLALAGNDLGAEALYGPELRHAETLLPELEKLLASARVELRAIELLAIGLGPGSFTGLRVGLATVKGLALATGLPVVGVSSLAAVAHDAGSARVVVVNDGQRGEVFAAAFERAQGVVRERVAALHGAPALVGRAMRDALGSDDVVCTGDGLELGGGGFVSAFGSPRSIEPRSFPPARAVAELARERYLEFGADDLRTLEPNYVRGSDAKLPAPITRGSS
jgi:tRNA threonylcarbamoyladenosine biosynthesis protein TsaB